MRSGFEHQLALQLRRKRVKFKYEALILPYSIDHQYKPDFILGNGIIIEAKGEFRPADRRKMLAVKRAHPDLDIRFVFQNANNKLNKKSKTTYAKWAERNGFPWAHNVIPDEWLRDKP